MAAKPKRFVKVKFVSSRDVMTADSYYYQDTLRTPLKKYEIVLVPTRYGFGLAVVSDIEVNGNGYSGVKLKVAERIKSKTLDELYKKDRAKDIEKQLKAKVEEMDKVKVYEKYAEDNPEVAELLAQFKELTD